MREPIHWGGGSHYTHLSRAIQSSSSLCMPPGSRLSRIDPAKMRGCCVTIASRCLQPMCQRRRGTSDHGGGKGLVEWTHITAATAHAAQTHACMSLWGICPLQEPMRWFYSLHTNEAPKSIGTGRTVEAARTIAADTHLKSANGTEDTSTPSIRTRPCVIGASRHRAAMFNTSVSRQCRAHIAKSRNREFSKRKLKYRHIILIHVLANSCFHGGDGSTRAHEVSHTGNEAGLPRACSSRHPHTRARRHLRRSDGHLREGHEVNSAAPAERVGKGASLTGRARLSPQRRANQSKNMQSQGSYCRIPHSLLRCRVNTQILAPNLGQHTVSETWSRALGKPGRYRRLTFTNSMRPSVGQVLAATCKARHANLISSMPQGRTSARRKRAKAGNVSFSTHHTLTSPLAYAYH